MLFRPEDQGKIRLAVGLRRVAEADIPESAKKAPAASSSDGAPGPSQKKRKATFEASYGSSQPSASQPLRHQHSQVIEIEEDEDQPEEESRDELYCVLKTNIVGVQYYKGASGEIHGWLYADPESRFSGYWRAGSPRTRAAQQV